MNEYEKWWQDYWKWAAPMYALDGEEYALVHNVVDTWVTPLYMETY